MKDRISRALRTLYTIREKPIYQKYARELVEREGHIIASAQAAAGQFAE